MYNLEKKLNVTCVGGHGGGFSVGGVGGGGCGGRRRSGGAEETGAEVVAVGAEPVLGVVYRDEVVDQLLVRLADVAVLALLVAEHHVVVQGVVDDRIT